jgi:hypothetical protein
MSKQREWADEVAAWRASGLTARKFCEERGYSTTRLYWWSSQLKRAEGSTSGKTAVRMARVVRKRAAQAPSPRAPIVIQVGAARVEVAGDADRDTLTAVLQSLADTSWGVQP